MRTPRLVVLVLLAGIALPTRALAQRDQLFDALQPLYGALAGTFGDEGAEIDARLAALGAVLTRWDTSLNNAEIQLRARLKNADARTALEVHTVLASAYAERNRLDEALQEIEQGIQLDPKRAAFHRLKALLLQAANRPQEAAQAYRAVWLLEPGNPQNAYRVIANPAVSTSAADRAQALVILANVERELVRGDRAPESPFLTVNAIRDDVGGPMTFAPAAYAPALSLLLDGQFSAGVAALREAAARDPLVVDPVLRTAPMTRGITALKQGRLPAAIEQLEVALAGAPDASEAHRILALAYGINGETARSVGHLRDAVRLNPMDERSWVALSDTLEAAGERGDALQVLRTATDVIPDSGLLRWLRAVMSEEHVREDDVQVIRTAERAVLLSGRPDFYGQTAAMAAAHFNFGRRLELFQQRVALAPNDAAAHRDLGLTYEEQGADEVAYAELVIALLIDPADVASLTALGRLHIAAGDYARAVETLQRAVSFAPQYGAAVQALGTALMRSGRAEEGRKRLDEAMRLHFFSVDEQRRLRKAAALIDDAEIHMRERRYSEAVILWQRALQLESMNAAMHVRLGEALAATKRYVEAAAQFEQAIALKGNPDAHLRLAETYAAMGRTDDSARERRAYIESRLQPLRRQSVQPN